MSELKFSTSAIIIKLITGKCPLKLYLIEPFRTRKKDRLSLLNIFPVLNTDLMNIYFSKGSEIGLKTTLAALGELL
jgi:hypothetical protein